MGDWFMKRPDSIRFPRLGIAVLPVLLFIVAFAGKLFCSHPDSAFSAEPFYGSIDGIWQLALPMPGGAKNSILRLSSDGNSIAGTMSSPGVPTERHAIYDGSYRNGGFKISADIGRTTYSLEGTHSGDTLSFDLMTTETIHLEDGNRLSGNTGDISGRYLVPVYSPGGIMENHFELSAKSGLIAGQMYVPVTETGTSSNKIGGAPPAMQAPPGELPASPSAPGVPGETGGDKRDVNIFFDGTHEGNRISLFTRTAQGSFFHFTGIVEGDTIRLDMHVTDHRNGLEAVRKEATDERR
jgi:hypothetical protein